MPTALTIDHFKSRARPPITSLPTTEKLAERMADACRKGISRLSSAQWRVVSDGMTEREQMQAYSEANSLRLESECGSLTGQVHLDRQAVSALLDCAMGSTGTEGAFDMSERPLSRIELGVLRLAQAFIAEQLVHTFSEHLGRPFSTFDGVGTPEMESGSQAIEFRYVANVFGASGEIVIMFSKSELEAQMFDRKAEGKNKDTSVHYETIQREVGKSELTLTVCLAPETLTVDALVAVQCGRVVELAATASTPVTIYSGDVAIYRATLGRQASRLAVTLIESIS